MAPGGTEIRLLELMRRLCPDEFRVDVCALSGLNGSLDGNVGALGGRVFPLRLDTRFPTRFLRLLRREHYAVVHSHVLLSSGVILAFAAAAGTPVRIAHFHSTHDGRRETRSRALQRRVCRFLIDRFATDIIACGEGAMDAMWGDSWRLDRRCRVVYDALDPGRFRQPVDRTAVRTRLGIPNRALVFLHIGNEVPEKNHRRLFAIFKAIHAKDPSAWLVLAGARTDDRAGISAAAVREFGIGDRVVALGVRQDVPELLHAADVLLLPSIIEGLPGVVLEACVVGVPVLATDLPGVREIASRLQLVRYLSLTADDREWASLACTLPAEAERLKLRETAAQCFGTSIFHIDRAAEAHRRLWSGSTSDLGLSCP